MKKLIGFIAIAFIGLQLNAQTSPEIAPPPAPLPPAPSAPTLKTTPVVTPTPTIAPVPAPSAPPLITPAPVAAPQPIVTTTVPVNEQPRLGTAIVYNDRGYNLSVVKMKGVEKVYIRDKTTKTYINLSTWNSRQDFYEKKYGTLPSLAPKL